MKKMNAAADAATVAGQIPDNHEQVIVQLVKIATQVQASIKTLGLHGKGVSGANERCNTILKSTVARRKIKAASELAAGLKKGNADAQKLSIAILDILQPKVAIAAPAGSQPESTPPKVDAPAPSSGVPGESEQPVTPATEGPRQVEARSIPIDKIKTDEPFSNLFPRRPDTIAKIAADMRQHGFDPAHPIVIWQERNITIDGHQRITAASDAGLKEIPAVFMSFADEDEALDYAIHCQRERRNLTDAEIMSLLQALDKRRSRGGDRRSADAKSNAPTGAVERSSKETAAKLGVSSRKVDRGRRVLASGDASLIEAVKSGTKTISGAEAELKAKEPHPANTPAVAGRAAIEAFDAASDRLRAYDAFQDFCKKFDDLVFALEATVNEMEKES